MYYNLNYNKDSETYNLVKTTCAIFAHNDRFGFFTDHQSIDGSEGLYVITRGILSVLLFDRGCKHFFLLMLEALRTSSFKALLL